MFTVVQPSELKKSWILGRNEDTCVIELSKENTLSLKNYHLVGIEYLYQNFVKKFKGSIINSEYGLDIQYQVSLFIKAVWKSSRDNRRLILVLTPDHLVIKWHYHLTVDGGFSVKIVTKDDSAEVITESIKTAILLPFSCIKEAESLLDYDYSVVVVDHLDEVANKLILRKIFGKFNIGLTERNFYLKPDQKLQWAMLNWANPGCVGKLADFYEIDNDNFANFRDNYRFWWLRLTWNFCESFERKTDVEIEEYNKILADWASSHNLLEYQFQGQRKHKIREVSDCDEKTKKKKKNGSGSSQTNAQKTKKSRGKKFTISKNNIDCIIGSESTRNENKSDILQQPTIKGHRRCDEAELISYSQIGRKDTSQPTEVTGNVIGKISSSERQKTEKKLDVHQSRNLQKSSTSTSKDRTFEREKKDELKSRNHSQITETETDMHQKNINCTQKPKNESIDMDDNPILSFLMDDDNEQNSDTYSHLKTELCEKEIKCDDDDDDDDEILRSIIDDSASKTTTVIQQDRDLFYKKEEILSQIYDTGDRSVDTGTDFLTSFIDS